MTTPILPQSERDALILDHRTFARRYALKLVRVCSMQEHADDAISEAMVGLLEAARRFDPSRGLRFGTYAKFWIRNRVFVFIAHNKYALRQTNTHRVTALAIRMSRISTALAGQIGGDPDLHDYAAALGVSVEEIDEARQSMRGRDWSVSPSGERDGEDDMRFAILDDRDSPSPEAAYAMAEALSVQRQAVDDALADVSERDADIVRRRMLTDATLESIAAEYGITRERARQIQAYHQPRVEARLRQMMARERAA